MKKRSTGITIVILLILVLVLGMFPVSVSAADTYDLGTKVYLGPDENPVGLWVAWRTWDGNLDFEILAEAKTLSLEFNEEVNAVTFIFCGDGNGWGWAENRYEVNGTSIVVTMADLKDYDTFVEGNEGLFVLTVNDYSILSGTILKSAVLNFGEAPAAPVVVEEAAAVEEVPATPVVVEEAPAAPIAGEAAAVEEAPPAPVAPVAPAVGDNTIILVILIVVLAGVNVMIKRANPNKA